MDSVLFLILYLNNFHYIFIFLFISWKWYFIITFCWTICFLLKLSFPNVAYESLDIAETNFNHPNV